MADAKAEAVATEDNGDAEVKDTVDKSQEGSPGKVAAAEEKPTDPEDTKDPQDEVNAQTDDANDDKEKATADVCGKRALEEATDEEAPAAKKAKVFPVTLGYCTFQDSKSAHKYFRELLSQYPADTPLNEYEFKAVAALLKEGHTHPKRKIGKGVKAITLKHVTINTTRSTCFFLHRVDGSSDDFSYRKCLANLLGEELAPVQRETRGYGRGGGRRNDGGGRRGAGRRGRGRGRGRGRNQE